MNLMDTYADSRNYIDHVPKNHVANLIALGHDEVHGTKCA